MEREENGHNDSKYTSVDNDVRRQILCIEDSVYVFFGVALLSVTCVCSALYTFVSIKYTLFKLTGIMSSV